MTTPIENVAQIDSEALETTHLDDPSTDTVDSGTGEATEAATHPGAEAAKYRVRAREAEAALATAQGRIEAMQTREALRAAGEHLAQPADLLALGDVTLADLLDDNGDIDLEAVANAAAAVIESRPGLAKNFRQPAYDHTQGRGSNPPKAQLGWDALLK